MPRSVELISVSVASPSAAPAAANRRDQQIAVKVIDDRGNELLVVKRLDGAHQGGRLSVVQAQLTRNGRERNDDDRCSTGLDAHEHSWRLRWAVAN